MSLWVYYSLAFLLFSVNVVGFLLNVVALPGNWLIVVATACFCWTARPDSGSGITWPVVGVLVVLALFGECIEFFAGTAGAAKSGASKRAMALSVVGSLVGSLAGALIGLPIPVVGSAVGAVVGGALGAALGAAAGEDWKRKDLDRSIQVGEAAFWGRILGTVSKVAVGAVMLVVATVDSIW